MPSRRDRFALLGDGNRIVATPYREIRSLLASRGQYDIQDVGPLIWVRAAECRNSAPTLSHSMTAEMTATGGGELQLVAAIEQYKSSVYADESLARGISLPLDAIRESWKSLTSVHTPSLADWNCISMLMFRTHPDSLLTVVQQLAAPTLFRWFPEGTLFACSHSPIFEERASILRTLRTIHYFHAPTLIPDVPRSLSAWQQPSASSLFSLLVDWASLLTFPRVTGMSMGPFGFNLVFVDDNLATYEPPPFPSSLLSLKFGQTQFGMEDSRLRSTGDSIAIPVTTALGRWVWQTSTSESAELMRWVVQQTRRLIRASTDITTFERSSLSHTIDLVTPQEQLLSLDRAIRRILQLQSAEATATSRVPVFEIADTFARIAKEWGASEPEFFRSLFSPRAPSSLLNPCFASLPSSWRTRLEAAGQSAYSQLTSSVKQSIWASNRSSATGVDISTTRATPQVESWDEFIPEVVRDLRNTHHGYFPREDDSRTRLLLSTGDLGPSISFLPSLWLMAFLGDPVRFLGWPRSGSGW